MTTTNSAQAVIPTSEGVLVPWSHRRLIEAIEENEKPCRCSSCGLLAGVTTLGYGVDGSVCVDCNSKVVDRLRSYRAA